MTRSVATIAQQSLRRLGVRVVPVDDSPTLTERVPVADIARAALVELGVLNSDGTPGVETVTAATIATQALIELGVIAADETPAAADQALMLDRVASVHASLFVHGQALWTLATIPRAFAEEYVKLTAAYGASAFGKAVQPEMVQLLETRVRTGAIVMTADVPFMLDKIASVHAALDAQGSVFWTGDAIPRAFVEDYVKLTVAYASASFGKPADPQLVKLAESRIRAGVMVIRSQDAAIQAVQAIHDDLVSRGIARWTVFDIPEAVADSYVMLAAQRLAPLFGGQVSPQEMRQAEVSIFRYVALPMSGETMVGSYF
jgi:hypothetical protein